MEQVEGFLASLPDDFSKVSILVNNAGLALGTSSVHEYSPEVWTPCSLDPTDTGGWCCLAHPQSWSVSHGVIRLHCKQCWCAGCGNHDQH